MSLVLQPARTRTEPEPARLDPLRVCHVMTADLWAGAEAQVATAASHLARRRDIALSAVLFNDGWLARELRRAGIDLAIVDERRHGCAAIVTAVAGFLRTRRVDVVHTHRAKDTVLGSIAAAIAGVPHVVRTVHGLTEPMSGWGRARYAAYDAFDKAALWTRADRIVAVSHATADVLKTSGYRRSAVRTIHNGVDLSSIRAIQSPAEVRIALGLPRDAFVIGTAGRLVPVKGHEHLIRAIPWIRASEPDARVVIIGSGPEEQPLRALARSLRVDQACVFVDPAVDRRAAVYDLVAAVDVFALPSLSEGIPMALLEAMALERPVVASAVGGVPEIIADATTGLLVEPRQPRALADACLALARNRTWARMLGIRGRRTIEASFSSGKNGDALAALYHDLVRSAHGRPVGAVAIAVAPIRALVARVDRKARYLAARRAAERLRRNPARLVAALARARHVLVVCYGNIIRSPFAERLIRERAAADVSVASAGLGAEPGRPSPPVAIDAAGARRIDLRGHVARRLSADDVRRADAVFVMDVQQQLEVLQAHPDSAGKVFLLSSLAADTPLEVHDPVEDPAKAFEICYAHIARAVAPIVRALGDRRS